MIARRLRDKYARGEPITIQNFVINTIIIIIIVIIIIIIIVSTTKFSIVIGSPRAYLRHAITVSNKCVRFELFVIGYL